MPQFLLTREVENLLGAPWWQLRGLVRSGKIVPAPKRNILGHYLWSPADVERAREALKTYRPRKYVPRDRPVTAE